MDKEQTNLEETDRFSYLLRSAMDKEYEAKIAETKRITPLLQGAIDMHYHGYPEISLQVNTRLNDMEMLKVAKDLGMSGIVIKSHMWPTMGRVYHLRQSNPDIGCFSSITLNPVVGGLSPWVVEAAARQGAKVVWLPTWGSTNKMGKAGFSRQLKTWFPSLKFEPGLCCIDSSGKVTPEVNAIIRLANELNLVLGTGHISPMESLAIAAEAERIGFTRLVYTHPLSGSVGSTLEQAKEMVKRGAYVELLATNVFAGNLLREVLEFISELGARHCILSTDAFREWQPPGPEFLRMFLGRLLISGINEASIKTMVQHNPAILLSIHSST